MLPSDFYGSPVAFIFTIDKGLSHGTFRVSSLPKTKIILPIGSWLDLGIFIQSLTLQVRAHGLESIIQVRTCFSLCTLRFNTNYSKL